MMETLLYMEANMLVISYGLRILLNLVVSLQRLNINRVLLMWAVPCQVKTWEVYGMDMHNLARAT
jgi:hypothetical protein